MRVGDRVLVSFEGSVFRITDPEVDRYLATVEVDASELVGVVRTERTKIAVVVPVRHLQVVATEYIAPDLEPSYAMHRVNGLWVATCDHCGVEIKQQLTWSGLMSGIECHHKGHTHPSYSHPNIGDNFKASYIRMGLALRQTIAELRTYATPSVRLQRWKQLARVADNGKPMIGGDPDA